MDCRDAARARDAETTLTAKGAFGRPPLGSHDDPIVAEMRTAREALFAAAGYDLEEFCRQIRASEVADGVTSVMRRPSVVAAGAPAGGQASGGL